MFEPRPAASVGPGECRQAFFNPRVTLGPSRGAIPFGHAVLDGHRVLVDSLGKLSQSLAGLLQGRSNRTRGVIVPDRECPSWHRRVDISTQLIPPGQGSLKFAQRFVDDCGIGEHPSKDVPASARSAYRNPHGDLRLAASRAEAKSPIAKDSEAPNPYRADALVASGKRSARAWNASGIPRLPANSCARAASSVRLTGSGLPWAAASPLPGSAVVIGVVIGFVIGRVIVAPRERAGAVREQRDESGLIEDRHP